MSGILSDNVGRSSGLVKAAGGGGVAGIATNSTSGTAQTINSDNSVTFPLQPHVVSSQTNQDNITGDNTEYTILYAAILDVTSDMNEGTGIFTAPQDGVYQVNAMVLYDSGFSASHTYANMSVVSSNRSYFHQTGTTDINDSGGRSDQFSVACDCSASDTIRIKVQVYGSAKTCDLGADGRLTITKIN